MGAEHGQSTEEGGLNIATEAIGAPEITQASELIQISVNALAKNKDFQVETDELLSREGLTSTNKVELISRKKQLEFEAEQLQTLVEALTLANEELPETITQLKDKKNLNTEYIIKSPEESARLEKQLDEETRRTLYIAFSSLKDCEYPVAAFGSVPYVALMGEKTNKKPKDLDTEHGIQGMATTYMECKRLQAEGKVEIFKLIAITNIQGEKNGCYELLVKVKGGKTYSVFFVNNNPEKEKNRDNGIITVGLKQNKVDIYQLKNPDGEGTIDVYLAAQETEENLYAQNLLLEISLVIYENYKEGQDKYSWITPKMMDRFSNLLTMNGNDLGKLMDLLSNTKNEQYQDKFDEALEFIKDLRKSFMDPRFNEKGSKGLVYNYCTPESVNCLEDAVAILTEEIKVDMKKVYDWEMESHAVLDGDFTPQDKIAKITELFNNVDTLYREYSLKLNQINNKDPREFALYAGIKGFENDFLFKVELMMDARLEALKNELPSVINN